MSDDPIDGEVVDDDRPSHVVTLNQRPTVAVAPSTDAAELVARLNVIREAMNTAMQDGIDYGRIPGVDKPTLLKPGSEKLGVLFQLDVQIVNEKTWGPGDHLTVSSQATVYHAPTGTRLGYGEGMCSTREKKYAKRHEDRKCPQCAQPTIKRSKFEDKNTGDKGWYCYGKIGGCGAQFHSTDPAIVKQTVGDVENPELPDLWNTVLKMSEKRARVDAVLAVTGASALFTQDAEDAPPAAAAPAPVRPDIPADATDLRGPSEVPPPPPVEDRTAQANAEDFRRSLAVEMKRQGVSDTVGAFRDYLAGVGIEAKDVGSREKRWEFIKALSESDAGKLEQALLKSGRPTLEDAIDAGDVKLDEAA